jgi:hypothetical protein
VKEVSKVRFPSELGREPLNSWLLISSEVRRVRLPIELGIVPENLYDPDMDNFMYVKFDRIPMSSGIAAPALKVILPRVGDTGIPVI